MPAGWQCKAGTLARVSRELLGQCLCPENVTGQGQDSSGAVPLEWLMSGHQRAAGFQYSSLPASFIFGSAWGTLLWDEDPLFHGARCLHVTSQAPHSSPRPWDILLLDSLKWNRLALCLLAVLSPALAAVLRYPRADSPPAS